MTSQLFLNGHAVVSKLRVKSPVNDVISHRGILTPIKGGTMRGRLRDINQLVPIFMSIYYPMTNSRCLQVLHITSKKMSLQNAMPDSGTYCILVACYLKDDQ